MYVITSHVQSYLLGSYIYACICITIQLHVHMQIFSLCICQLYCLFIELGLSSAAQKHLPELDALHVFYEKICSTLPVNDLLPELVSQRVITINDKSRVAATGKTEFERTQYLLDQYVARPLSAGDPNFFNILLNLMSTTPKCDFLVNQIQQYLSTTAKCQKFSSKCTQYPLTGSQQCQLVLTVCNVTVNQIAN